MIKEQPDVDNTTNAIATVILIFFINITPTYWTETWLCLICHSYTYFPITNNSITVALMATLKTPSYFGVPTQHLHWSSSVHSHGSQLHNGFSHNSLLHAICLPPICFYFAGRTPTVFTNFYFYDFVITIYHLSLERNSTMRVRTTVFTLIHYNIANPKAITP